MIVLKRDRSPDQPTIFARLAERAAAAPGERAMAIDAGVRSWRALCDDVEGFAGRLAGLGLGPGDRAVLISALTCESVTAYLGAARAGVSIAALPLLVGDDALARMIADAAPRVVFCGVAQRARLNGVLEGLGASAPPLWIGLDFADARWSPLSADQGPPPAPPAPETEFNIVYSSGTTGVPKGIKMDHAFRNTQCQGFTPGLGMTAGGAAMIDIPLYSNYAQVALLFSVFSGCTFIAHQKFDPALWLRDYAAFEPTHVFLVPAQYQRLLEEPTFDETMAGRPAVKFCSGAPFSAARKAEVLERWPGAFVEVYGMTEGAPLAVLVAREHLHKLHTVGRCVSGGDLKIIDSDGREAPPGTVGEIVGRTDAMMSGYHNRPDADEALAWRDPEGRAFFRSGDTGRLDEDGFLIISGRLKDVIITGGFNVYSVDLEQVLERHPDVSEAAVIGVPDARRGETPFAVVVLERDARLSEEALLTWANERLGKVQRLSGVAFRESLPRGTLDKVLRRALRDEYVAQQATDTEGHSQGV